VGKHSFSPMINPKATVPCIDYPSFHYLNVKEIAYDSKFINKVEFKTLMVKVGKVLEDESLEDLEKLV